MGNLILLVRMSLLAAVLIVGVIGAYHARVELVDQHGYSEKTLFTLAVFLLLLAATLAGGVLYQIHGRRRQFRIHAAAGLLLFGVALITVNSAGFYFLTAGALSLISLSLLATRRPADGAEPYRWLLGAARVRSERRPAANRR